MLVRIISVYKVPTIHYSCKKKLRFILVIERVHVRVCEEREREREREREIMRMREREREREREVTQDLNNLANRERLNPSSMIPSLIFIPYIL
jgi:hypothetical protein